MATEARSDTDSTVGVESSVLASTPRCSEADTHTEQAVADVTAAGAVSGLHAGSLVCNTCWRKIQNMAAAQFHAEKTGHDDFCESAEQYVPRSEQETIAKLDELKRRLAEKRARQSKKDGEKPTYQIDTHAPIISPRQEDVTQKLAAQVQDLSIIMKNVNEQLAQQAQVNEQLKAEMVTLQAEHARVCESYESRLSAISETVKLQSTTAAAQQGHVDMLSQVINNKLAAIGGNIDTLFSTAAALKQECDHVVDIRLEVDNLRFRIPAMRETVKTIEQECLRLSDALEKAREDANTKITAIDKSIYGFKAASAIQAQECRLASMAVDKVRSELTGTRKEVQSVSEKATKNSDCIDRLDTATGQLKHRFEGVHEELAAFSSRFAEKKDFDGLALRTNGNAGGEVEKEETEEEAEHRMEHEIAYWEAVADARETKEELERVKSQLEAVKAEKQRVEADQEPLREEIEGFEQRVNEAVKPYEERLLKFRDQAKEQNRKQNERLRETNSLLQDAYRARDRAKNELAHLQGRYAGS